MPFPLNMNLSQMEAARLEFPKTAARQDVYRYYGVFTGTVGGEIFLDGTVGKRLQIPVNSGALVIYDMVCYEYNTTSGAFASVVAASGGRFILQNNNTVVTAVANSVAPVLSPTAQIIATVTPSANDATDALQMAIAVTGTTTTKVVEIIASASVANKLPSAYSGLS